MNKFFNFKIETFALSLLSFSFYLFDKQTFLCLFLILIGIMFVKKQKITDFFINILAGILFAFIYIKINRINFIPFNNILNWIIGIDLREKIINHVNNSFSENNADFIKLIIFNVKEESIKNFYNKLSELSISHLVVVSGFHLSIIPMILTRLIKVKKISIPINLVTMFFLNYLTAFSIGSFRAFLFYIFSLIKRTKKHSLSLSAITTMMIAPFSSLTLSFQMSYLSIFALKIFKTHNINSHWKNTIFTSLGCTLFLLPFINYFSNKISIFFIIYSFVFTPLIIFVYFLTLIFFWFPYYEFVLKYLVILIFDLVDLLTSINVFIPLVGKNVFSSFFYWITLFLIWEKNILDNFFTLLKLYFFRKA